MPPVKVFGSHERGAGAGVPGGGRRRVRGRRRRLPYRGAQGPRASRQKRKETVLDWFSFRLPNTYRDRRNLICSLCIPAVWTGPGVPGWRPDALP